MIKQNYRIGLDIGIASVGWAVLGHDADGEPNRILARGVRVFEAAEKPKDGKSLAEERREARSVRRRLRRKKHRLERIKELITREFNIDVNTLFETSERKDIYVVRYEALDKKIEKEDWARLLIHLAQKRGFKSNRRSEKEGDAGALLKATSNNKTIMEAKGYRTVGEFLYKEHFEKNEPIRNKKGDYKNTFLRSQCEEEVDLIFVNQIKFGNKRASEKLKEEYKGILFGQRGFDAGPGKGSRWGGDLIEKMRGKCTFCKNEPRAPKNSYTFERFMLVQKVNNLKGLTQEQKEQVIDEAHKTQDLKFTKIRKSLKLADDYKFNFVNYSPPKKKGKKGETEDVEKEKKIKDPEDTTFVKLKGYHSLKDITTDPDEIDRIAYVLTVFKTDERIKEKLLEAGLTDDKIEKVLDKNINFTQFGHLSTKAIKQLLPHLEEGMRYDEAATKVFGDHRALNKDGKRVNKLKFNDINKDIVAPVVKRAVSQTFKVVNAIIREYGNPELVCVEVGREAARSFRERQDKEKEIKENQEINERIKNKIVELGVPHPRGQDIEKYKLWQEQQNICAYCQQPLEVGSLFSKAAEVDHIIPWSVCFDNGYRNKVVVHAACNQEKGNRIPMEYIKTKGERRVDQFRVFVGNHIRNLNKRSRLLKEVLTEEDLDGFKQKNLQDTQHATRTVANFIRNNLEFAESENFKNQVITVNGGITSFIRKRLSNAERQKDRSTDNHHAEDAIFVALAGNQLTRHSRLISLIQVYEASKRENGTKKDLHFPEPWKEFRQDMSDWFSLSEQEGTNGEKIKPLFVSRMTNHKITGQAHAETIMKVKDITDEDGKEKKIFIKKVSLDKLTPIIEKGVVVGIKNYYEPQSDTILYNAIINRLNMFGGDAKKAFEKQDFYKPTKSGENGNIVRTVKVFETTGGGGLELKKVGANAANGAMVRVDVFSKPHKTGKKQFYLVPIYVADFKKKELPITATNGNVMDDTYSFEFSLYAKDLISIQSKGGLTAKGVRDEEKNKPLGIVANGKQELVYYTNTGINGGLINVVSHNKGYKIESIGSQNLEVFEKWEVDVLGNVKKAAFVPRDTRTLYKGRNQDKQDYILKKQRKERRQKN
ncbi:MAG: type II CRISPR RNA-guided endonuclease Cas9 [Firmicutes bacterium]|nr:type II CRISPR RNA-guided endonuclease Cas9 [Bacillota bacterium]